MGQESSKVTIERGSVEQSTANASAPSVTTEEIRSQIERTRAEMSETIDAIQNRLSPRRLMTDAKEKVKDAFSTERAIQVVKSNPVPMALIGAAVAALTVGTWMRSRNGSSRTATIRDTHAGHTTPRGFGPNKRTVLLGACSGFACWRAWRAHRHSQRNLDASIATRALDFD
jgi:hypothetical protein